MGENEMRIPFLAPQLSTMIPSNSPLDLLSLQQAFANAELLDMRGANGRIRFLDHLLARKNLIKLKIYQEKGHARPHFHVDYGVKHHLASYVIDTGERLEGTLHQKYDRAVADWAKKNREPLLNIWTALQAGDDVQLFTQTLTALP